MSELIKFCPICRNPLTQQTLMTWRCPICKVFFYISMTFAIDSPCLTSEGETFREKPQGEPQRTPDYGFSPIQSEGKDLMPEYKDVGIFRFRLGTRKIGRQGTTE